MMPYFNRIVDSMALFNTNKPIFLNVEYPSQFYLVKNENYEKICIFGDKISSISSRIANAGSIKQLSIENTNIKEVPVLPDLNFTEICIRSNRDLKILLMNPANFKKLKTLDLSNNRLMLLNLRCNYPNYIEDLDLSNNKIIHISTDFMKFYNLKRLNLKNNKLKYIPRAVKNIKSLEMIDLEGNPLEEYSSLDGSLMGWIDVVNEFKNKKVTMRIDKIKMSEEIADLLRPTKDRWNFPIIGRLKAPKLVLNANFECLIIKNLFTRDLVGESSAAKLISKITKDSENSFENIYNSLFTAIYNRIYELKSNNEIERAEEYLKEIVLKMKMINSNSISILRDMFDKIIPVGSENVNLMLFLLNGRRFVDMSNGCRLVDLTNNRNNSIDMSNGRKHSIDIMNKNNHSIDMTGNINNSINIKNKNNHCSVDNSNNHLIFVNFICKSLALFKNTCLSQLAVVFGSDIEEFCVFEYYKYILEKYIGFNSLFDSRMENIVSRYKKSEYAILKNFLEAFQVQKFIETLTISINNDKMLLDICRSFISTYCNDLNPVFTNPVFTKPVFTKVVFTEVSENEIKNILCRLKLII